MVESAGLLSQLLLLLIMVTDEQIAQWRKSYVSQMVSKGVDQEFAESVYVANETEHDFESNPFEAAIEEMSYWE